MKQPFSILLRSLAAGMTTLLLASPLNAADYYVSSAGSDAATGGADDPWQSMSKVNATTLQPGDRVLFRRGDRWAESLIPRSSGAAGSPITYDAYGEGPLPVITGLPNQHCISWETTRSYLVFRHLHLQGCGQPNGSKKGGISVWSETAASRDIIIEESVLEDAQTWNMYLTGVDGLRIRGNIIRNAELEHGIYLDGTLGMNDAIIEENDIHGNADMCVQFNSNARQRLTNLILRYNRLHDCGLGGLNNIGADGLLAHHNLFYGAMPAIYNGCDGDDNGCNHGATAGVYVNNTLLTSGENWATCFSNTSPLGAPDFSVFVNNICVQDAARGPAFEHAELTSGQRVDYNLFFSNLTAEPRFVWNGRDYTGFESYRDGSGNETNGLFANPVFVNPIDKDFQLGAESPAIDSGADFGFSRDLAGQPVPTGNGPDRGAFEATSANGGEEEPPAIPGGLQIEFDES